MYKLALRVGFAVFNIILQVRIATVPGWASPFECETSRVKPRDCVGYVERSTRGACFQNKTPKYIVREALPFLIGSSKSCRISLPIRKQVIQSVNQDLRQLDFRRFLESGLSFSRTAAGK